MPTRKASTIPTPPPFGVGFVWLLRAPGVSIAPSRIMTRTAAADSSARQAQKAMWVAKAAAVTAAPAGGDWPGRDRLRYRGAGMPSQRSALRILTNVALDGALAAVAAVVARWVADPGGGLLHPLWFLGGGAITLLVGGLPFRLSQQYWRFSGIEDLVGVAGGSVLSAALFALVWTVTGYPLPTPTFPIVHALTLVAFLGAPRVFYRLSRARPRRRAGGADRAAGRGGGGCGQFPARLGQRARPSLRVIGLLSLGRHQTGRRIQGCPILGGVSELRRVLDRLGAQAGCPTRWW